MNSDFAVSFEIALQIFIRRVSFVGSCPVAADWHFRLIILSRARYCQSVGVSSLLQMPQSWATMPAGVTKVGNTSRVAFCTCLWRLSLPFPLFFLCAESGIYVVLSSQNSIKNFLSSPRQTASCSPFYGRIAQLVEQLTLNQLVRGSSPRPATNLLPRLCIHLSRRCPSRLAVVDCLRNLGFFMKIHSTARLLSFSFAVLASCLALSALCASPTAAGGENVPTSAASIRHRLLMLDESRSQLIHVDEFDPGKNWTVKIEGGPAWGIQLLDGTRALVAIPKKGGFREYDLKTRQAVREKFDAKRYSGAVGALRLANGQTVLGCEGRSVRIFLFDAQDAEVAVWNFPKVKSLRQIRQTSRGTLLFGSNSDRVFEISMEGKILREVQVPGAKYNYQVSELPNGNWLTAAGYGGFLAEVDKEGKVVRRWGGRPEPQGLRYIFMSQFQVLGNGNILVATWTGHGHRDSDKGQQLVEFTPEGQVVWKWHDRRLAGSIHSVVVLDEPARP